MRFISLRLKLIVAFIFFILLPIFGSFLYTYHEFENILKHQIEVSTADHLHQVNLNIERELKALMNASNSFVVDESILEILESPPLTEKEKLDATHQLDKKLLGITTAVISNPAYFSLFDNEGNLYTSWGRNSDSYNKIYQTEWFQKTIDANGYMVWTLNHENYVMDNKENLLTVSMVIRDSSLSKKLGVLVISQPVSFYLSDILNTRSTPDSIGFIVDQNGEILSADRPYVQSIYKTIEPKIRKNVDTFSMNTNGENAVVSTYSISLTNWKVIQLVPHKSIFKEVNQIRTIVFITLISSMTIFIIVIILFSSMLTRPLRKLRNIMKNVETGILDTSIEIKTRDEVGLLGRSFNNMLVRLRGHIEKEIILERKKEQFKLEALQAQINPHFLHNTLNTIKWMSIMAGTKNITEMLLSLGHLLNMSIHRGQDLISLREEMKNIQFFLTIQKYRYGDKIKMIEEIDPITLEVAVPKLSLQPLVENVYQHGLFMEDSGEIRIRSRVDHNNFLYLEVIDNGMSLDAEKITEIRQHITLETSNKFSGIGLSNVHKRVQMIFGDPYGLSIHRDEENSQTLISIKLPFRRIP